MSLITQSIMEKYHQDFKLFQRELKYYKPYYQGHRINAQGLNV